ncbi:uncharacterized protein TNCT_189721 [Trichonephila clavata]|uniref:ALMS motif domain-containing protein n=1 Tax=Trichonephila clavata TaxID=2740835 RepID=A0A8X6GQ81_TRICU|nr:uncharacterized protein TNCT_189721 [Trichonephila clavata]
MSAAINQRCEPMGGEVDNSPTSTISAVTKHDNRNDLVDSFPDDQFVDELTLKVRSLLKSWEDAPIENDSNNLLFHNQMDIHEAQLFPNINEYRTKKSTNRDLDSNEIAQESQFSSELKCNNDPKKFDYSNNHTNQQIETKPFIELKNSTVNNSSLSAVQKDPVLQNISEPNVNKYPLIPRISINKTDEYGVIPKSKFHIASSTQGQSVEDPMSYYEFSNTLQNVERNPNIGNQIFEHISKEHPVLQSTAKSYSIERKLIPKKQNIQTNSSHLLSDAAISTDMFSRDSSDKETERSWSEITVVAESFLEPKNSSVMRATGNISDSVNLQSIHLVSHQNSSNVKENFTNSLKSSCTNNDNDSSNRRLRTIEPHRTFQELDREFNYLNYRPNSSLSDHDTPPLSASSMASSKRLEWDNGADIGYSIIALNSKIRNRTSIPTMARSEPEGISFINEATTSVGTPQITLQGFTSISSSEASTSLTYSHFDGIDSKASSVHDPGVEDLLERSSSPGSLSRSDSKKSVIYNSVRDMRQQCKIQKPNPTSVASFYPSQKNSSWPDLSVKNSQHSCDWSATSLSNLLSKSEELISSKKYSQSKPGVNKIHVPGFSFTNNIINKSSDSFQLPERNRPLGEHVSLAVQSVPKHFSAENVSHSCKSCQSPLNVNIISAVNLTDQRSDDVLKLQEGNLESFEFDSETLNSNQITNTSQFSHHYVENDWFDENNPEMDSNLHYVTDIPELSDYQFQTFHSRPLLLLSNDSSKLKENNISNIVHSFFGNSSTSDHSVNGNLEVKPHIRWYPFTSASHLQDIKNVSTQTSVSFIAKDQMNSPVQVCDQQVLSKSSSLNLETNPLEHKTFVDESYKIAGFPDTSSRIANVSFINNIATSVSEYNCTSQLDKRTDTFSSYSNPVTSNSKLLIDKDNNHLKTVSSRLNDPNLVNYPAIDTGCTSCEGKIDRNEDKTILTSERSSHSNRAEISRYNFGYDWHTSASNLNEVNFQDSIYSPMKKIVGLESNYVGNQLVSTMERRVGVGQCRFSSESLDSKNSDTDLGKSHIGQQSKEISLNQNARKSSSLNVSDSLKKNVSQPVSLSNTVTSRTTILNEIDTNNTSYFHTENLKKNSDETLLSTLNYRQNIDETILGKFNASSVENQTTHSERSINSSNLRRDDIDIVSEMAKHFPATKSNLSELFSQNHPPSVSHDYKNRIIQKSHSDPLITVENPDIGLKLRAHKTSFDHQESLTSKKDSNLYDINHRINLSEEDKHKRKYLDIEEKLKLDKAQNIKRSERNQFERITTSTVFCETDSIHSKNQFPKASIPQNNSHLLSHVLKHTDYANKSSLKEQDQLFTTDRTVNSSEPFKSSKYYDVTDDVLMSKGKINQRIREFDLKEMIHKSVGIQVPECIHGSSQCNFCHKSKKSHMSFCYQKEAFKTVLNHTLARRIKSSTSGTSFCAFSSGCYCCCNKSLQEAFNFHRPELVERIEARKKEVEGRCKGKLFVHIPLGSHAVPKQSSKLKLKPVTDVSEKAKINFSNKENNRRNKRNNFLSEKNKSLQKARQKNLNKYNRIMSKIYSQRLKSETLKGKVNHQRNEILIKS